MSCILQRLDSSHKNSREFVLDLFSTSGNDSGYLFDRYPETSKIQDRSRYISELACLEMDDAGIGADPSVCDYVHILMSPWINFVEPVQKTRMDWVPFAMALQVLARGGYVLFYVNPGEYSSMVDDLLPEGRKWRMLPNFASLLSDDDISRIYHIVPSDEPSAGKSATCRFIQSADIMLAARKEGASEYFLRQCSDPHRKFHPLDHMYILDNILDNTKQIAKTEAEWLDEGLCPKEGCFGPYAHRNCETNLAEVFYLRDKMVPIGSPAEGRTIQRGMACPFRKGLKVGDSGCRRCPDCAGPAGTNLIRCTAAPVDKNTDF